ncbi:MAG: exonuclease domain-containing protein [Bacteroidia bacterium]
MYAIIDTETTGGSPRYSKIIEIAICVHDGQKVVQRYQTLVNPECPINPDITGITHITNDMVRDAPRFYEIARNIIELTEGRILVAHNSRFDYAMLKGEYQRLGYQFARKQLCTVKLSRQLLPGHPSYSLGKLCRSLNIQVANRHRAMGDAAATAILFDMILEQYQRSYGGPLISDDMTDAIFPPNMDRECVDALPHEPGVYYFYNENRDLIYVGKSRNIRKRVISHFSADLKSGKSLRMKQEVAYVDCEVTGSDLLACLLEDHEIKRLAPKYNRAGRKAGFRYGIYTSSCHEGYLHLKAMPVKSDREAVLMFTTTVQARNHLKRLVKQFQLCEKLAGLESGKGNCFGYSLHKCLGACAGKEPPVSYNLRVESAIGNFRFSKPDFMIIVPGREVNEYAAVQVQNHSYQGFGYFSVNGASKSPAEILNCIQAKKDNPDVRKILRQFLKKEKKFDLIEY